MARSTVGRPGARGAALGIACGLLSACANEMPPPGTLPDEEPPSVRSIEPPPDSVVPGFDGAVRIRFDEPVNVPSDLGRRLVASPMEIYDVETGFSDIRIRPRAGWRDSVVYCLTIPEGISDLLRNRTPTGIEFCFSTGIPITNTSVTGTVFDAMTGRPQGDATVQFIAPPDSTPYGAVTDADGRFSLRSLPDGAYEAFGFVDRNRNYALDRALEPHDSTRFEAIQGASPDLELRLVEPDTTAPLLLRVEVFDSLTLRAEFDDPLLRPQPGRPLITVADTATGAEVGVLDVRIGEPAEAGFRGPDSVAAVPDTVGAAADTAVGGAGEASSLPSRFVSIRLGRRLPAGVYRVHAEGFVNLRRLTGGGDTTFVAEPPAPPDSAAAEGAPVGDTTDVSPDTTAAPPDTTAAPPDTSGVPPDTSAVADTAALRRTRAVPDLPARGAGDDRVRAGRARPARPR